MTRQLPLLALILGALVATSVQASVSVDEWLLRMEHAEQTLDYRGTLVRAAGSSIEAMRIVHRVGPNGIEERIFALDGAPREVLRVGDRVHSLVPGKRAVVVDPPIATGLVRRAAIGRLTQEQAVYRAELGGTERVAGRMARIIELYPQDRYRYARRLWLDAQTGMLLRSLVFEPDGEAVEKLSFVDIELGARIEDVELASVLDGQHLRTSEFVDPLAGAAAYRRPSWLPEALPRGFRLVSVGAVAGDAEHLLFSDGLASVSIYIESGRNQPAGEQLEARGATHIYTGNQGGRMVTVVGEVPAATVSLIGQNLRPAPASAVASPR
ncbi:MAG: MucB/RseB C-terminal domain-containing protein [Wenzhouxiangellaceae bacterium]|nr:MucB/RseB C-terminal domain-containing protein [Wenzhouxiangellaceae bacterium]